MSHPSAPPPASAETLDLIATAAFGLEAVVQRELTALGYAAKIIQPGRILFHGDATAICRANLWLRAADRVLVRLGGFEATDFGQLFDRTTALPWERWITADASFPVNGRSIKSQLSSVPACQKIVKKAVVERLRAGHGVSELDETGPSCSVEVGLLDNQATLTLDTSGPGLHKRGYRRLVGAAPLKETLAAAMVMLTFWRPERPLVDPFCGSGTIPIEAAMIGRNLAPGLKRTFAAERWPAVPEGLWEAARREAELAALPELPQRILGTDTDPEALDLARHHAQQAGVAEQIHFQQRDFADLTSKRHYGCVICNPPYGERLGQSREVMSLYRAMPEVFRRLKTWSFYILAADSDFESLVGQKADRRRKLYNGRIECTYYQFYGPKPPQHTAATETTEESEAPTQPTTELPAEAIPPPVEAEVVSSPAEATADRSSAETAAERLPAERVAVRPSPRPAFGGLSAKSFQQAESFRSRLVNRARHLRRWPTKLGITCYRLYDRDVPEVPLVVDRYEDCLHLSEYERPHDRTPAEHADWLDLMKRTAAETLEVPRGDVFLKHRRRQRGADQYERVSTEERIRVVSEAGLRFEINLSDYTDVGLFLDHRITRSMVRRAAEGKHFLNLFAYTGAFSVYAAAGGAASTTTVDLSANYLDWAARNMALNRFEGPEHQFLRDDAMEFLSAPRRRYDLAVVDVPTFSNSKRLDDYWDVQRDHAELLRRLFEQMTPGGVIYFSSNFRRFKLAEDQLAPATFREISRQTVPPDFRNRRIHRCWRIVLPQE